MATQRTPDSAECKARVGSRQMSPSRHEAFMSAEHAYTVRRTRRMVGPPTPREGLIFSAPLAAVLTVSLKDRSAEAHVCSKTNMLSHAG